MEMRINRLPAITWNRMDINDISVNLPKFTGAELAFDTKLDAKQAMHATTSDAEQATHATVSNSKWAIHDTTPLPVSTGAGAAADGVFEGLPVYDLTASKGEILETKAEYLGSGNQGAVLQVTAQEDSQVTLYTHAKPAENGSAALRILLKLGKNAKLPTGGAAGTGEERRHAPRSGRRAGEDFAKVEVLHLYLGSGDLYSGCRMDLIGGDVGFTLLSAGYLGKKKSAAGCQSDLQPHWKKYNLQHPSRRAP